jgi:hypothetical protein
MDEDQKRRLELGIPDPPPPVRGLFAAFKHARMPQTPTLITPRSSRLLAIGFLLPVLFMIVNYSEVTLVPEWAARKLIAFISVLWPVAAQNYESIKAFASEATAINYAVFLAVMLVFVCGCLLLALKDFAARPEDAPSLGIDAFAYLALGLALYFGAQQLNVVKQIRTARYDFTIDATGFYYLNQYILIIAGSIFVYVLLYLGHRIFRHFAQAPSEQ